MNHLGPVNRIIRKKAGLNYKQVLLIRVTLQPPTVACVIVSPQSRLPFSRLAPRTCDT